MKDHPILFSAPMVLAILEGRKTQTRRIMNPQPQRNVGGWDWGWPLPKKHSITGSFVYWREGSAPGTATTHFYCPHGLPGDRLWGRETWRVSGSGADLKIRDLSAAYRNDLQFRADRDDSYIDRYYPSIFMPRWASRITLDISTVRIERLQDITAEDAIAEGLKSITKDGKTFKYGIPDRDGLPGSDDLGWDWQDWQEDPVAAYARLWDSINGKKCPWASNPYVWAVTFREAK